MAEIKVITLLPFVTYYGYCHSLYGATLFSKIDSNKLRFNVKYEMRTGFVVAIL